MQTRIIKESIGFFVEKSDDNFRTYTTFGFSPTLEGAKRIVRFDDPEINYRFVKRCNYE